MKKFTDAMGAVMLTNNIQLLEKLESFLSNPLQPLDYPLLQEAYNEIVYLHKAKDALFNAINTVGDININLEKKVIKLEKKLERCKNNAIDFAQSSAIITNDFKDNVERLRSIAIDETDWVIDAANEIERLREQNEYLKANVEMLLAEARAVRGESQM